MVECDAAEATIVRYTLPSVGGEAIFQYDGENAWHMDISLNLGGGVIIEDAKSTFGEYVLHARHPDIGYKAVAASIVGQVLNTLGKHCESSNNIELKKHSALCKKLGAAYKETFEEIAKVGEQDPYHTAYAAALKGKKSPSEKEAADARSSGEIAFSDALFRLAEKFSARIDKINQQHKQSQRGPGGWPGS